MIRIAFLSLLFLSIFSASFAQSKYFMKVQQTLTEGDTSKAVKKLNKYIEKTPNDALLYKLRAEIKIARKDFDPAMLDLNSYCSLNPNCEDGEFLKGQLLYNLGDYSGCVSHFDLTKNSIYEESALVYKGLAYMWLYQYAHAERVFEQGISKFSKSKDLLYNASILAYRTENYDRAENYIDRFLEIAPTDFDGRLSKALIYTKQKKYIESNLILRELLKESETNPSVLYSIAVNYYHLNEFDMACNYFKQARNFGHEAAEMAIRKYCKGR